MCVLGRLAMGIRCRLATAIVIFISGGGLLYTFQRRSLGNMSGYVPVSLDPVREHFFFEISGTHIGQQMGHSDFNSAPVLVLVQKLAYGLYDEVLSCQESLRLTRWR